MSQETIMIKRRGEAGRRDHRDIPFVFQGYGKGYIRLLGPMAGIPPTLVISSDRQVEVEVILHPTKKRK